MRVLHRRGMELCFQAGALPSLHEGPTDSSPTRGQKRECLCLSHLHVVENVLPFVDNDDTLEHHRWRGLLATDLRHARFRSYGSASLQTEGSERSGMERVRARAVVMQRVQRARPPTTLYAGIGVAVQRSKNGRLTGTTVSSETALVRYVERGFIEANSRALASCTTETCRPRADGYRSSGRLYGANSDLARTDAAGHLGSCKHTSASSMASVRCEALVERRGLVCKGRDEAIQSRMRSSSAKGRERPRDRTQTWFKESLMVNAVQAHRHVKAACKQDESKTKTHLPLTRSTPETSACDISNPPSAAGSAASSRSPAIAALLCPESVPDCPAWSPTRLSRIYAILPQMIAQCCRSISSLAS